jgi:hypothetical protein
MIIAIFGQQQVTSLLMLFENSIFCNNDTFQLFRGGLLDTVFCYYSEVSSRSSYGYQQLSDFIAPDNHPGVGRSQFYVKAQKSVYSGTLLPMAPYTALAL